jgi:hypothetical protein
MVPREGSQRLTVAFQISLKSRGFVPGLTTSRSILLIPQSITSYILPPIWLYRVFLSLRVQTARDRFCFCDHRH